MTEDPGILEPTLSKHRPQMLLLSFMRSPRDVPEAPDAANDFSPGQKSVISPPAPGRKL